MLPLLSLIISYSSFVICKLFFFFYSTISHSNDTFVSGNFVDKHFTALNLNLVNEPDLMRTLQFEIFVHSDEQLRVAHVILGYKPISTSFQDPKYVIKAKDSWLHKINVAVPGFLAGPPPEGTHRVELSSQRLVEGS